MKPCVTSAMSSCHLKEDQDGDRLKGPKKPGFDLVPNRFTIQLESNIIIYHVIKINKVWKYGFPCCCIEGRYVNEFYFYD